MHVQLYIPLPFVDIVRLHHPPGSFHDQQAIHVMENGLLVDHELS